MLLVVYEIHNLKSVYSFIVKRKVLFSYLLTVAISVINFFDVQIVTAWLHKVCFGKLTLVDLNHVNSKGAHRDLSTMQLLKPSTLLYTSAQVSFRNLKHMPNVPRKYDRAIWLNIPWKYAEYVFIAAELVRYMGSVECCDYE